MSFRWLVVGVLAATTVAMTVTPGWAAPDQGTIRNAGGTDAIAGSYIVALRDGAASKEDVAARAGSLTARYGGGVDRTFGPALRGFAARMSATEAKRLAADPAVRYVEQNQIVRIAQYPVPSWGLDVIDGYNLDGRLVEPPPVSTRVNAYVVDTGIRYTHADFGGRAVSGRDFVDNDADATDCNGHGTHVAGTIGGNEYGVAKRARLIAVRVFGCGGSGTIATVIAGIDWVVADHDPLEPAVANLSFAGAASQAVDDAVNRLIADQVVVVAAAGNAGTDACTKSPARVPGVLTVGATDASLNRAPYSNRGSCLDLFAPGSAIVSTWYTDDTAVATLSGTSMAAAHTTGVAAIALSLDPDQFWDPVVDKVISSGTRDRVGNPGAGSPNVLLHFDEWWWLLA